MKYGTVVISERLWREIDKDLRRELLKVMPRKEYVGRYAGNVYSDLWMFRRGDLAKKLEEEIGIILTGWAEERGYYHLMHGHYMGQAGASAENYLRKAIELTREIEEQLWQLFLCYTQIANIFKIKGLTQEEEKVRSMADKVWKLSADFAEPDGRFFKYVHKVRSLIVKKRKTLEI